MAATFGPGPNVANIIWHGGTEYGSHILSGRTKYGSYNWSRIKCGCRNRSTGQFLGRTVCAMTGYCRGLRTTTNSYSMLYCTNSLDEEITRMTATISFHIYKSNSCTKKERAILRHSELLNDAFRKTHPWLAQKVVSRSAHVTDMLLAK